MLNARYLARLGYGMCAERASEEAVGEFVERLPDYERALAGYDQVGNSVALRTIEDRAVAAAEADPGDLRRWRRETARAVR